MYPKPQEIIAVKQMTTYKDFFFFLDNVHYYFTKITYYWYYKKKINFVEIYNYFLFLGEGVMTLSYLCHCLFVWRSGCLTSQYWAILYKIYIIIIQLWLKKCLRTFEVKKKTCSTKHICGLRWTLTIWFRISIILLFSTERNVFII